MFTKSHLKSKKRSFQSSVSVHLLACVPSVCMQTSLKLISNMPITTTHKFAPALFTCCGINIFSIVIKMVTFLLLLSTFIYLDILLCLNLLAGVNQIWRTSIGQATMMISLGDVSRCGITRLGFDHSKDLNIRDSAASLRGHLGVCPLPMQCLVLLSYV